MLIDLRGIGPEFAAVLWWRAFTKLRQSKAGGVLRRLGADALAKRILSCTSKASPAGNPRLRTTMIRSRGYGCDINRIRRWRAGSMHESNAMVDACGRRRLSRSARKAARRAVEICDRWRRREGAVVKSA